MSSVNMAAKIIFVLPIPIFVRMRVEIYTDGSSRGNPGPGGYGVILKYGQHERELSQGYRLTTNNRMELLATIVGLETLTRDKLDVTIYSDSKYVVE